MGYFIIDHFDSMGGWSEPTEAYMRFRSAVRPLIREHLEAGATEPEIEAALEDFLLDEHYAWERQKEREVNDSIQQDS